jgi:hypothetical protein
LPIEKGLPPSISDRDTPQEKRGRITTRKPMLLFLLFGLFLLRAAQRSV